MKKTAFTVLISVFIAWIPLYMGAWDKALPAGTTPFKDADDKIRDNNAAIETAFDNDHVFTTGSTQTGEHNQVTLAVSAVKPTVSADEGALYNKDVDPGSGTAIAELFYEDEDATEIQLTSSGNRLANATYFTATDNAGTGSVDLIKAHTDDEVQLGTNTTVNGTLNATGTLTADAAAVVTTTLSVGTDLTVVGDIDPTSYSTNLGGFLDEDAMGTDSATAVASQQSIKAYVDTQDAAVIAGAGFVKASTDIVFNTTMTVASTFQALDLSGTVGSNTALVFLEVTANAAGNYVTKPTGRGGAFGIHYNANHRDYGGTNIVFEANGDIGYVTVLTDSSGSIDHGYTLNSTTITITVLGYIK